MGKPSMHTTQWLSSEQKYHSRTWFAGMWRDMAVWVSYGGINISGRIKQSIYPRTRHGELKVISMIYAPPYLIRRSVSKVKSIDHKLATSPTVTPKAHKAANTGKQATVAHYYYEATPDQEGNTIQRTTASHLPSRAVTNRLSGASVTHDEYRTFTVVFKLVGYR